MQAKTNTIQDLYYHVASKSEEETILNMARVRHKAFHPFKNDGRWTFEVLRDSTPLPEKAREIKLEVEREIVKETGIEPQIEWVVAHEMETQPIKVPDVHIKDEDVEKVLKGLAIALGVAVVAAFILPLILLVGLAGACASGDPALIAVVKNSKGEPSWIVCYKWY